ncbi:MAG: acetyl-CoA carboxylase carboxyltransferase subunit alpha [Acidobacteria bacterium SCN 69-37]|nr:MAG: acetyl-CoA carboxylase carboxyltransferase subunit alpha [Acidobacteria bacterium SCN 69-37]
MPELLDFEEPVAVLLKEIEAMGLMPQTPERRAAIAQLETRVTDLRTEIFRTLKPWQRVQVARHPSRPSMLDYVDMLFTDFTEVHGDRRFADDKAIVTGFAFFHGEPVAVIGHQKGRDTKAKIYRNFGYAKPEGYRKALRVMQLAHKFKRPIVVFIDTPAAYPGIESEERGVAEAIALNLREMTLLDVPIVVLVSGEGGSGGALGIAVGDRVLMQEFSVYSVIPPEGCAAILWRDAARKVDATEALKITAPDLLQMGIIDEIIPEPAGGAHQDHAAAAALVDEALVRHLDELRAMDDATRLNARYDKFRGMGRLGHAFIDDGPGETTPTTDGDGRAG